MNNYFLLLASVFFFGHLSAVSQSKGIQVPPVIDPAQGIPEEISNTLTRDGRYYMLTGNLLVLNKYAWQIMPSNPW